MDSFWYLIDTAQRTPDEYGQTPRIILGFAADEYMRPPESREGFWSPQFKLWVSASDPHHACSPQPTHWMPLPRAPNVERVNREEVATKMIDAVISALAESNMLGVGTERQRAREATRSVVVPMLAVHLTSAYVKGYRKAQESKRGGER